MSLDPPEKASPDPLRKTAWLEGLNPDQGRAVSSRARHLLVQAGAGSGKTFVIVRRILHLVDIAGVPPSHILAVTFTRNAALQMARRLEESAETFAIERREPLSRVEVCTFHSLCYRLLKRHWKLIFDQPMHLITDSPISPEEAGEREKKVTKRDLLLEAVRRSFEIPRFRMAFKRYLWNYWLDTVEGDPHGGQADSRPAGIATLSGLHVRSWAERDIANWLHEQGIPFHYSDPAPWSNPQFAPDFYLPGPECFIEIWEYEDPRDPRKLNRLAQFSLNEKRLIQIEHDELFDFPALEKRLAESLPEYFPQGLPAGGASDLDRLLSAQAGYPEAVDSFLALAEEVLDKMKNHAIAAGIVAERAKAEKHLRTRAFFRLFLPVYERYQALLEERGALDFNDMILRTVELLRANPALRDRLRRRWTHLLVDEYQDVNSPQVDLLRELVGSHGSLTVVGDDWQSIYGFRGSDVSHIRQFERDFPTPEVATLRLNYRSGRSIVEFAGLSIRRCRHYTDKELFALNAGVQPVKLFRANQLYEDGVSWLISTAQELIQKGGYAPEDLLVLYRRASSFRLLGAALKVNGLRLRHLTIHAAKGLESPVVFIWAVTGGRSGFPGIWDDSRVTRLLLPRDYQSRLDEEKRVFYVALTRARERLFIVTERRNPSEFLDRLPAGLLDDTPQALSYARPESEISSCAACGAEMHGGWLFCPCCYHGLKTGTSPKP